MGCIGCIGLCLGALLCGGGVSRRVRVSFGFRAFQDSVFRGLND